MKVFITKSIHEPKLSPHAIIPGSRIEVPDELASRWIKRGSAIPLDASGNPPRKPIKETATR